jgi:hypothetical protein
VFDKKLPKPRGFSGRPLIALLFAVGMGILGYCEGLRFQPPKCATVTWAIHPLYLHL